MKPNTCYIVQTDSTTTDDGGNFDVIQELVRCKDCIHRKDGICEITQAAAPIDEALCSYGDRRE